MIRKGILKSFDSSAYTASVRIVGSLSVWLDDLPVSEALSAVDMVAGRSVAVMFLDPSNPNDAIVIGLWGAASAAMVVSFKAEAKLDLSGAAQSNVVILHTTRAVTISKLIALYTEASSANAGVAIKVGKETDDDYYYTGTSEVSKAAWYEKDLTLLQTAVAAGDTVICSNAGGKTGTGEILFCVEGYFVD